MLRVDVFNHLFPERFWRAFNEVAPDYPDIGKRVRNIPCLWNLDERFRVMDRFDDYVQIVSLPNPPLETIGTPETGAELARIANDSMAELCGRYPDRFPGFVASVDLRDAERAAAEARRAVGDLGAVGVQIFTNVAGAPLDEPRFEPFFAAMHALDRPIWMHPARGANFPDYLTERKSKYEIWWTFGWPYETSAAQARLVFSGHFDRYPGLKLITHHMGGMVPYFEGRVGPGWDQLGARTSDEDLSQVLGRLRRRPIDYFREIHADTALFGARAATECGLAFYGADRVLFASDSPFDPEKGPMYIRLTIEILDALDISEEDRRKIYHGNIERLTGRTFG